MANGQRIQTLKFMQKTFPVFRKYSFSFSNRVVVAYKDQLKPNNKCIAFINMFYVHFIIGTT